MKKNRLMSNLSKVSLVFSILSCIPSNMTMAQTKYLGNIYQAYDSTDFSNYWNQVTPENAGKWGSVESSRDNYNWANLDRAYNFAKSRGMIFKQHTFVWGSQQPPWIDSLSQNEQRAEVEEFINDYCQRYPDTDQIDVVNEPISAPASFAQALGGSGSTGWDWVITSFQFARQYCPNASLLINEYGIINDSSKLVRYKQIIDLLHSRGLIDGIGIQSHSFNLIGYAASTLQSNLDALAQTGLPIYVSEWDIDAGDQEQLLEYQEKFPIVWSHSAVKGVTLWGYIYGTTWLDQSGLIYDNGTERPAFHWLMNYVGQDMGGGDSHQIRVYARGTIGGEAISLRIAGNTVQSWTLSTSFQSFSFTTDQLGSIAVAFTNDNGERDVQIDYIEVDGQIRQAEDQSINTGAWGNNSCGGGSYSEWLHCNGEIVFGTVL